MEKKKKKNKACMRMHSMSRLKQRAETGYAYTHSQLENKIRAMKEACICIARLACNKWRRYAMHISIAKQNKNVKDEEEERRLGLL